MSRFVVKNQIQIRQCPINLESYHLKKRPPFITLKAAESFWPLPQISDDLTRTTLGTFSEEEFEFSAQQEQVFLKLEGSMRECSNLLAIRSFSDLFAAFVMVFVALASTIVTGFRIAIMLQESLKMWWRQFLDKTLHRNPEEPEDASEAELIRSMTMQTQTQQYEFSHKQEQVFRDLVNAMHVCGLGLLVLTFSDLLIIISQIFTHKFAPAAASFFNTLDDVVVAILIFRASKRFDKIIRTVGHDISLLIEGLGSNVGLCLLFKQIGQVAIFLAIGQFIQNSAILTAKILQKINVAPFIVESFNDSVDVILGILSTIM